MNLFTATCDRLRQQPDHPGTGHRTHTAITARRSICPAKTKDKPHESERQERHTLAAGNNAKTASAVACSIDRWIEAKPKLLGDGTSPASLTWAFASSVAKSSGYVADQRRLPSW
jgi:hypothetical protein